MNHLFTVQQLFAERLFRIPDYQRGYAWEEQQLEEFVEDVELLPEQREHYTGTIVLSPLAPDAKIPDTDEGGKHYERWRSWMASNDLPPLSFSLTRSGA